MTTRNFHVGDVLSVTTGKALGPRLMEGIYEILRHLCGEPIFTHQIPRVLKQCGPLVLKQHPQLAEVTGEGVTRDNFEQWLADIVVRFGETLPIEQLAPGEHYSIDPISEAAERFAPGNIAVIRR